MKQILCLFLLLFSIPSLSEEYSYKIIRVIDGDTIIFEAPFLPSALGDSLSLRIINVDTPEKESRAHCEMERALSAEATEYTKNLIESSKSVKIEIVGFDKYGGRVLGDAIIDGKRLSEMLLENGYAKPYDGGKKSSWCD